MKRLHRSPEVVIAPGSFGVLAGTVVVMLSDVLTRTRRTHSRVLAAGIASRVTDDLHAVPAGSPPSQQQAPQPDTSRARRRSDVPTTTRAAEVAGVSTSA